MRHSSGYGEAEIEFASGHKLVDNKVGDFRFVCPAGGDLLDCNHLFFLPLMIGHTLTPSDVCPYCLKPLGEKM